MNDRPYTESRLTVGRFEQACEQFLQDLDF